MKSLLGVKGAGASGRVEPNDLAHNKEPKFLSLLQWLENKVSIKFYFINCSILNHCSHLPIQCLLFLQHFINPTFIFFI